ncbi:MAG TPA: formylmethanofuran dehydrogenase subunit C [Pirellulales bacterium]|jgi:formylmethanofuran dehydrogenase subunit C
MALELSLRAASTVPIEVEGILPHLLREKSRGEIERWKIFHGNQQIPLAELFHVAGIATDNQIVFLGDMAGVHSIGSGLQGGVIRVAGNAGRHAGSEMTDGELAIDGDAGDWLGAEMHGGLIRVSGRSGHQVAAAYRGSPRGMTGGAIIIHGDAGDEVAHTMRRGLVAIGGAVGDFPAVNMIAGSLFVFGACGIRPAAGMQRGTLVMLGPRPTLLPTFRSAGPCQPTFSRVYLRKLAELGLDVAKDFVDASYELFHGDLVTVGRGEVLVRV